MSTTTVRIRLAARAWSRVCGGYGIVGQWKGLLMGSLLGSVLWTALVALPRYHQLDPDSACQTYDCALTTADMQVLVNYSFILAFILLPTELFIKPWARSMQITDELRSMAVRGVPEAAFALAELFSARGASSQAQIWLTRASDLCHRTAIKQLKRQKR
ncbi:hypothetical protein [Phaeobacter piscinae]|uniref:hypothetical protein n=1 Tax=Phaeobacter piscinae TaxID=1580596 RepID=UPI00103BB3A9|nr:hypothetical protein [Phaeobacter piscinae]UTS79113.1 hypothetical protein OL67_000158 [Phaeobacter piscinae]